MRRAENTNPAMLAWARETSGLSAEAAARKIGLSSSARSTAARKLQELEAGRVKPTRAQLEKIAKAYWQPLTTFYLASPPSVGDRGVDFRQRARQATKEDTARLNALLRNLCARQRMVRSLLEDDEDMQPLSWVGSMPQATSIKKAAGHIRAQLRIEDAEDFWRKQQSPENLFAVLRRRIEELGVFVLLAGDLGSHHTAISEKGFRGFAIADDLAPFIVINSRDAKVARAFTLIHELAHIMLGKTGISASPEATRPSTSEEKVERFCNDAASEFLLPEDALSAIARQADLGCAAETISRLAKDRNISEPLVAYRLWRADRISATMFRKLLRIYGERWENVRRRQRESASGGPSYYRTQRARIGGALLKLVERALHTNELTHTEAARILGVSSGTVGPLLGGRA